MVGTRPQAEMHERAHFSIRHLEYNFKGNKWVYSPMVGQKKM